MAQNGWVGLVASALLVVVNAVIDSAMFVASLFVAALLYDEFPFVAILLCSCSVFRIVNRLLSDRSEMGLNGESAIPLRFVR